MIQAGFGKADITPDPGLPLSGFAYRENKPSTHIDDSLNVRVLMIESNAEYFCFVSLEILAVGSELQKLIFDAVHQLPIQLNDHHIVLTAVHNHSAPITMPLAGEAAPEPNYLELIAKRTLQAVREAIEDLEPVVGYIAQRNITGLTYNRRAILDDGSVSMAIQPDKAIIERGPVDNCLSVIAFKNEQNLVKGTIAHFPCHGVAVCTSGITHDIPGRVASVMETIFPGPCLYLQSGCGDINPMIVSSTHDRLNQWTEHFRLQVLDIANDLWPIQLDPVAIQSQVISLPFRQPPEREDVLRNIRLYQRIAAGDLESPDLSAAIQNISNIINLPPGTKPEPSKAIYFANALIKSSEHIVGMLTTSTFTGAVPSKVIFFRLGQVRMAFVGAELFAAAGLAVCQMLPESINLLVTYTGPVIGYIPDDAAMKRGGYEVNDAWMFYFQPAPFELGALDRLLSALSCGLKTL